jgi:hypothetical protein
VAKRIIQSIFFVGASPWRASPLTRQLWRLAGAKRYGFRVWCAQFARFNYIDLIDARKGVPES